MPEHAQGARTVIAERLRTFFHTELPYGPADIVLRDLAAAGYEVVFRPECVWCRTATGDLQRATDSKTVVSRCTTHSGTDPDSEKGHTIEP